MRKSAKALSLVVVSLLAAIALAAGSAFTAALAVGAVGLFVPGTGTPDANDVTGYLTNARDRYTQGTPCSTAANCTPLGIDYPASFFPLAIIPNWCRSGPNGCDKWNDSVGQGTAALNQELARYLKTTSTEGVTIFGYSQGGAVVSNVLNTLGGLPQSVKNRLKVVTIGGIENPDGGLWSRLGFLPTIPFLDITFGPPMATNTGIGTTAIGFEYDPVTYAPRYWGNPLALLNAAAALETVHGFYLAPNENGPDETLPYGYTPGPDGTLAPQLNCATHQSNCRYGSSGDTTYVMIPATTLPIFDLVMGAVPGPLKPLVQPLVTLLTPVTKLLVDLGYDWSGDPDKPTPLSILPFNPLTFNPVDFTAKFVAAIAQGIQDVVRGGPAVTTVDPKTSTSTGPTATNPVPPTPKVSALAIASKMLTKPATTAQAGDATTSMVPDPVVQVADSVHQTTVPPIEGATPPAQPSVVGDLNPTADGLTKGEPGETKDPIETKDSVAKDASRVETSMRSATDDDPKVTQDTRLAVKTPLTKVETKKDAKDVVKKDETNKDAGDDGESKKAAA